MEKVCRFCLDSVCNEQIDNYPDPHGFVSPCRCDGTQKYVHRGCLEKWRRCGSGGASGKCLVCNTTYKLGKISKDGDPSDFACIGEFVLVFESTVYFLYLVFTAVLGLSAGSMFTAILMGPALGVLQPIQKSIEKCTDLPIDQNHFFYTMVIPGGFFLAISGLIVVLHVWSTADVGDDIKQMYLILTLVTFTFGVSMVHTCIYIWMKTNEFIAERRLKLMPQESIALDFECI